MVDFLIKSTPLPLPRPILEEVIMGGENAGIKLDIPIPDMADIDLTYPLVGLDWVVYPWTYLKGKTMDFVNELHSQLNTGIGYHPSDWTDLLISLGIIVFLASVAVVGYYIVSELFYGLKYLWKKFW